MSLLSDFKRAPEMEWGVMPKKTILPQLVWIMKLCHTQAGVPGLFGAIAFGGLYRAQQHAAADTAGGAVGRVSNPAMEMSVARCARNAEQYMRLLLWASNKLPHLLLGDLSKQTKESQELFDLDPETEGNTLFSAIDELKTRGDLDRTRCDFISSKAKFGQMRDILNTVFSASSKERKQPNISDDQLFSSGSTRPALASFAPCHQRLPSLP